MGDPRLVKRLGWRVRLLLVWTGWGCEASPPLAPPLGCGAEEKMAPLLSAQHVPIGTSITWNAEPPSSGQHYGVWAAFKEHSTPVPRGYYVHDLEHGAVVLVYNCDRLAPGLPCASVVQGLRDAAAAIPSDPICAAPVRVRVVISPDPLLPRVVGAAAWGHSYLADCVDAASLTRFATRYYGMGPESLCADGVSTF